MKNITKYPELPVEDLKVGHVAFVRYEGRSAWFRINSIDADGEIIGTDRDGGVCSFEREHIIYGRDAISASDYCRALNCQDASNGVALTHAMSDVTHRLMSEMLFLDKSLSWVTSHPVYRLYLHKLNSLSGINLHDLKSFSDCYHQVQTALDRFTLQLSTHE